MNTQNNKSDCDISSDSSWTFINDSVNSSRKNSFEKVNNDIPNCNPSKEILEQNSEYSKKQVGDPNFLTFDECSFERLAECDASKPKVKKCKKKRKTSKKCYEDPINLLSIMACLLTITGITLLTTLLPPTLAESADLENLQNHLSHVYEHSNNPTNENAVNSLHAANEAINSLQSMDVLNVMSQNLDGDEKCEAFSEYANLPNNTSEFKIRIVTPYAKELSNDEDKSFVAIKVEEKGNNTTKTLVGTVKDIIKSPSLQIFVVTLIQDLCLIRLINEFSKYRKNQPTLEKIGVETATKILKKSKKLSAMRKKSKKAGNHVSNGQLLKKNTSSEKVLSGTSGQIISNISSVGKNQSKDLVHENGKSECERRFEALDIKGATLGYNHRQKIQQIKDKFQKEIFQIKEQEKENYTRSQKINFTREKFLQRLKSDREIYLQRLRKIREERKQLLNSLCHGLNSSNLGSKDASVGNYAVFLPSSFDFSKKIEDIKENARSKDDIKLEAYNNETFSYVPFRNENDGFLERCKNNYKVKEIKFHTERYCELKRKYLRKKARLMKKRQAKKDALEVQDLVTNIVEQLSEVTPQPLALQISKVSEEMSLEPSVVVEDTEPEFEMVNSKKKPRKRDLNTIYQAAFEGDSKKIKQNDARKWNKNNFDDPNITHTGLFTKQDPLKVHKTKIIHKGVL